MTVFGEDLEASYAKAQRGTKLWSFCHHLTGYSAVAVSAVTAFIAAGNLEDLSEEKAFSTACLAAVAAVLSGVSSFGGFARKWQANRITRTALGRLRHDVEVEGETPDLRSRFQTILTDHDGRVLGTAAE